jgi:hypothetical protein
LYSHRFLVAHGLVFLGINMGVIAWLYLVEIALAD